MKLIALIDEHPYEANTLIGIFSDMLKLDKVKSQSDSLLLSIDCDDDIDDVGYCLFSHSEMFGQVAHNIRYIASNIDSLINKARQLHADELNNEKWESEWVYEIIPINSHRLSNGDDIYIYDIDYTWKNKIEQNI